MGNKIEKLIIIRVYAMSNFMIFSKLDIITVIYEFYTYKERYGHLEYSVKAKKSGHMRGFI